MCRDGHIIFKYFVEKKIIIEKNVAQIPIIYIGLVFVANYCLKVPKHCVRLIVRLFVAFMCELTKMRSKKASNIFFRSSLQSDNN